MAIQKVVVVDGNNLIVRIDRGVAGRSVTDVEPVEISGSLYLVFTFSDGTTETVGPVGTVAYVGQSPIVINASTISLSTVPVNLGGTGQITANAGFNALAPTQTGNTGKYLKTDGTNSAWDLLDISTADITGTLPIVNGGTGQTTANTGLNALLPVQTGQANKYLQTDGTNTSWDAISLSTADITGVLPVVNGGTGVTTSTGTGSTVLSTSPTLVTPALGTPSSGVLTNATDLPIATGVSGLGTGVSTFLATPSSANLAATVTDETGTGALVFATSPTLVTPALGTPASGTLTNATGLPVSTGISGLGTGVATFLATPTSANLAATVTDETGTGALVFATSPTLVTPALGTPASGVMTNVTGTAAGLTAGNVTTNANLTGMVTSIGNATTVVTNANLTGGVTSVGNATTVVTNANLTGAVTSLGNATSLGSFTSAELATALTDETGTGLAVFATSPTLVTPALGTPSALVGTNITGTASGLTAGNVTTNANLTGMVTSIGNATTVVTNANLTGGVTSIGNATTVITNANLTGSVTSIGNATTVVTNADLTGMVTSVGNATTVVTNANLTGDVSSIGNATTLATVATAGVTGSSTAIPVVTINAKGLTTSITTAAVIAPAGTLTGSTLASGVTSSSLTSLGTIGNLSVTAGTIATTPSAATDIANKDYVDTVAQGLDPKASCVAATTIDIILSAPQTIDGIALIAGDRCLVKNQTAQADNGIYVVAAGSWTRSNDMNTWAEVSGAFTFIEQGTTQADTGWVCTSNAGGTLGTTPITFVQFAGVGSYTAGTGLTLTGTQFSLTTPVTVALGGTNSTSAGIGSFNNITGYTASGATGTTSTNLVFSTSPTLVTPILGTPQSATLTNATDLPISTGVSGLGTGVATFLATPSSANLLAAVTDETGTGSLVFANSPTLITPALGTPSALVGTNITGTAANFNINGTVGATTPSTVTGTTVTANTRFVGTNFDASGSGGGALRTSSSANVLQWGGGGGVNLTLDGAFNMNPANASISIAPTGTGTLTINPATAGTINNMAIGGTTPSSGAFTTVTASTAIGIASGGTGQTTANTAFNALAPSQTGNSGKYLTTDGTDTSWASNPLGTVTSVGGTGTVNGLTLTGTVTTSGNLTLGGTLSGVANSALTNSSITIGGTAIALGGSSNALANDITIYGVTVGRGAGAVATNTAVGASALAANTSGNNNTAVGQTALTTNTTGNFNTAVGRQTLFSNTSGTDNSGFGLNALVNNTTGSFNTAIGRDSLQANTTASNNTAVGYQAAYANVTGTNLTLVGFQAGTASTGNNVTAIGARALLTNSTGSSLVAVGGDALRLNTSGASNTAVGQAALYTNNTGSFNTAMGNGALELNTTASNNTAVGYQAGYSQQTGNQMTAVGSQALYLYTGGSANTAVGYRAAYNSNGSADNITAMGNQALFSNTAGTSNSAFGAASLYTNSTGIANSGFGSNSLQLSTTGSYNTGLGNFALFSNTTASNNVAVGYQAGYTNQTGQYNTLIGVSAGVALTSGGNTLVGAAAGTILSTGTFNTFIGPQGQIAGGSGGQMTSGSQNTILGAYNGDQNSLNITTLNNYLVLSNGAGTPAVVVNGNTGAASLPGTSAKYNSSTGTFDSTLQIGSNLQLMSFASGANTQTQLTSNAYYSGGYKAIAGGAGASKVFVGAAGSWSFDGSASLTNAGDAITFIPTLGGSVDTTVYLQGAASYTGTGITFPATQYASSNANTLDDYEEGTWTPTITFGGGSTGITYGSQNARYTKIGNRCYITCYVAMSNKGSSTGGMSINGLPFTSQSGTTFYNNFAVWANTLTGVSGGIQAYNSPGTASITEMTCTQTGSVLEITNTQCQNASDFMVQGSYPVA